MDQSCTITSENEHSVSTARPIEAMTVEAMVEAAGGVIADAAEQPKRTLLA